MKQWIIAVFSAGALMLSCQQTKKTEKVRLSATETAPAKDSVKIAGEDAGKTEEFPYRASNARQNDILHTRLEVSFDWEKSQMTGKATIKLKPWFYPVKTLYLDAKSMEIKKLEVFEIASVTEIKKVAGKSVEETVDVWNRVTSSSYLYENDSIKINLGRTFMGSENYFVVIDYVARPEEIKAGGGNAITDDKGLYFINPRGENPYKMPQIWTQGETQSSSAWFPTIDSPNEKMTQEILMTVDDKYITLSNGSLIDSKKQGNLRTDYWKLDSPHAPYLAMMAVGEFKKVNGPAWNGKEISYYVEKEYEPYANEIFGDTREMVDFYSKKLGVAYPWPKYAQIVVRDYVSGAMENTSATLHGDFLVYQTAREMIDGKNGEAVIAHELFHQWFGDLVTCESWSNLVLNEGFATYGEYLWEEYKHGRESADYHHWQSRQSYLHSEKEKKIVRYHYGKRDDMFDAFSYAKGGQVLHMLRKTVGDDAFFASLKNYLETNRFKSVEIHNLRLAFEETTGQDMNWFFNQWFLNEGRPKLKIEKTWVADSGYVKLSVQQNQDLKQFPLYQLPLSVDLYFGKDVSRVPISITEKTQVFRIPAKTEPDLVNFDAERQLLADVDYEKSRKEYIHQYITAPLFEDRLEALVALNHSITESGIFAIFANAARHDKFYAIRNHAISALAKSEQKSQNLKNIFIEIYSGDKKSITRARALEALNKQFRDDPEVRSLNEKALKEESYAICSEALQYFSEVDSKYALEKAKAFEGETGKAVLYPVANLYATHGGDAQIPFFHNAIRLFGGFELISFCSAYAKTAKRCENPANVLVAAKDLELASKGANRWVKYTILKALKELSATWESKEKTAAARVEELKKENKPLSGAETELKNARITHEALSDIYNRTKDPQ